MEKISDFISVKINPEFNDIIILKKNRYGERVVSITNDEFKKIVELFNEANS